MPLGLIIIGALLFIIAIRGNYNDAGKLFNTTFFGANGQSGFFTWLGSITGLAIIFRIIGAPKAGELFIALLLIVFFLKNPGILAAIEGAIQTGGGTAAAQATASTPGSNSGSDAGTTATGSTTTNP